MLDKYTVIWVNGQDRIVDDGASYHKQFRHTVGGWRDEEGVLDEPWLLAFIEDYHNLKGRMDSLENERAVMSEKKTIEYSNRVELINAFMKACKKLDPLTRSVRVVIKGDIDTDIKGEWDVKKKKKGEQDAG